MALTDLECRKAAPGDRPFKLTDAKGMHLLVQPNGSKLWRLAYRFAGKQKTLSLGAYPYVKLPEARSLRDAAREQITGGVDPMAVRKEVKPAGDTFREVAEEHHATWKVGKDPAHVERVWARLNRDAFPKIGDRPMGEIKPADVLAMVRDVEARGAIDISKRLKQKVGEVFDYAIATGRVESNPTLGIGKAMVPRPRVQHMSKISVAEMPEFLTKLAAYQGEELTRLAIQFTMLTWARTSEVRLAPRSSEFENLDGEEPLWRIPKERMKMARPHLVPLSRQAAALIKRIWELHDSEWLFPHDRKPMLCMSQNTMIGACYRMGYRGRMTIHGMRGTASTWANETGRYQRDWIELALAHSDENEIRSAYNSALYLGARRQMLQDWADMIDTMQPADEFEELLYM